jgi:hypothetical protein
MFTASENFKEALIFCLNLNHETEPRTHNLLLWRTEFVLAISEHGARSNLYDEDKAIVKNNN